MRIPRLIHQTFPTRELPTPLAASVSALKESNPHWQHKLYDDQAVEDFIRSEFKPQFLRAYQRINPRYGAARADLFRYLVVYRYGGVYLDIKSSARPPLDEIIQPSDRYLLAHWPNHRDKRFVDWGIKPELPDLPAGEFQNWHIIAEPNHAFLHRTLELVLHNIQQYDFAVEGGGRAAVLRCTGPIAYTRAILPLLPTYPHRLAGTHIDLGLRYSQVEDGGSIYSHLQFFGTHYSQLTEPVVLPLSTEKSSHPVGEV